MIHIRNQNYDQARHDFQIKTIRPKKTKMDGNRDIWNCVGDTNNYRRFPVFFQSNGPIYMTWGNCWKKGEDCPFNDRFLRLSTRRHNLKPIRFEFMTDPKQKGTIQEIIDQKYGSCEGPCLGSLTFSPYDLDSKAEDEPMVGQGYFNHCPYDGTRKCHWLASYNSCPWVLVFGTYFQHDNFHTLNDIPKSVLVPPETQYSLASVIFSNGAHLEELAWISEIHLGFTSSLMD
jgi:hypothetical protein